MKCYTQVYVMNSLEAVEIYCKAFGADVTFEIKNSDKTAYEHCELPWSKYCATVIDKYGVCWWLGI
ncbi:MAG: hypothetical protein IKK80_06705 [Treponema sp.]|nr:hypothetical protein [Treponema sp.]